jgi:hypothetical protein
MNITQQMGKRELVSWAQRVRALMAHNGDADAIAEIDRAISVFTEDEILLTVLGKTKRGKSTIVNALLGRRDDVVAPIDKLPASSVITRFVWAESESATVCFRDGRQESIGYGQVRDMVTEEGNPENRRGVSWVEVRGPFEGLEKDVILADTPGAGSIHEHHDQLLHAFIPQSDAVIFLVTASMPIDQDELDLLRRVKAADIRKVFFAINMKDATPAADIEAGIAFNRKALAEAGVKVDRIHRISALQAFRGDLVASGLPALAAEIGGTLRAEKGELLRKRLVAAVTQAAARVGQSMAVEVGAASKSRDELDADIMRLSHTKEQLERERALVEREFLLRWDRAVDDFDGGLRDARVEASARFSKQVQACSVFGVKGLAKELSTMLGATLTGILEPRSRKMESAMRDAVENMRTSLPSVSIQESCGGLVMRSKGSDKGVLVASLTGGAAVAAGVGVAHAAAAAVAAAVTPLTITAVAPVASLLGGLLSSLGLTGLGEAAVAAGTVTATTTAAAAAPIWAVVLGPVGWAIAGMGLFAVPLAWRSAKLKQKAQIEDAGIEHIGMVFDHFARDRVPAFRKAGRQLMEEHHIRLDRELAQTHDAFARARAAKDKPDASGVTLRVLEELNQALAETRPQGDAC